MHSQQTLRGNMSVVVMETADASVCAVSGVCCRCSVLFPEWRGEHLFFTRPKMKM